MASDNGQIICENVAGSPELDPFGVVKDDQYTALTRTFLATGKGRRPNLPPLTVNHRLLLQMYCLKEESRESWKKIASWFNQIRPDVVQHRVRSLIEKSQERFLSLDNSLQLQFLDQQLDLDFISTSLSGIGVTRATAMHPPTTVVSSTILVQTIVDFYQYCTFENVSKNYLYEWLQAIFLHFSIKDVTSSVAKTMKLYASHVKSKHRNPAMYYNFVNSEFTVTPVKQMSPHSNPPIPSIQKSCTDCETLNAEILALKDIISSLKSENKTIKKECNSFEVRCSQLTSDIESLHVKLHQLSNNQESKTKAYNDKERFRATFKFDNMRNKLSTENKSLKSMINHLQSDNNTLSLKLCDKEKSLKSLKSHVKDLEEKNLTLRHKSQCSVDDNIVDFKGNVKNVYSDNIRQVVLALISEVGISSRNVSKTIQIVSEGLFNHKLDSKLLPSKSSVNNFLSEGHVVSNIQVVENVINSKSNVTLHCDGTSRDQKKVVNHQFTVDGETYFLGFKPVANETAGTLLNVTMNMIQKLSESYAEFVNDVNADEEIYKSVLSKITSTMTDRASSMKLFGCKFEKVLQSSLGSEVRVNFLHCNAHFLLGLSSSCEKALLASEREILDSLGRSLGRDQLPHLKRFSKDSDCSTTRLLKLTCDVLGSRGDQKNGCHLDWITFCKDSLIPSFKSNRFNCFFEAACAIIHHADQIQRFFSSGILGCDRNSKIESVARDTEDVTLLSLVFVVALIHVKVTGPYWKIVTSKECSYSDFPSYVQEMHRCFQLWGNDPASFFDLSESVFGQQWSISSPTIPALKTFLETVDLSLLIPVVKAVSLEFQAVTEHQLCDFIDGGKYSNPSERALPHSLKHCPLTNLVGESAFGDLDYDLSRRRHCSLHNRSARHVVARNKTVRYIRSKSNLQRGKLFQFARRQARILKKEDVDLEKEVKNVTRQKFVDNQNKLIQKQVKSISRTSLLQTNVERHGGPCMTPDDVDQLLARLKSNNKSRVQIANVIKNEIRYCKHVRKFKTVKFGPLNFMIDTLKASLS